MNEQDRLRYITNLFIAAAAAGRLHSSAEDFIDSVGKSLKLKKNQVREAQERALKATFNVASFERVSVGVQNLEDTATVLLRSGGQNVENDSLMTEALTSLGLGRDAARVLVREAKERHKGMQSVCAVCSVELGPGAKFCSSCGAVVEAQGRASTKAVATSLRPEATGVTVAFAESSAAGFVEARRLAEGNSKSQEYRVGSKTWYAASFALEQRSELLALVKNLKGMRNREVYIDGSLRQWDACFRYTYCAVRRESAFRPTEFCFGDEEFNRNCWGCGQLSLPWTEWAEWFSWGHFVDETTFEFDMPRIEHELLRQKQSVDLCPYFREKYFEQVLKLFPQRVTVNADGDWDYQDSHGRGGTTFEVKVLMDFGDGDTQVDTRHVSGVTPRSRKTVLELMKAAAHASGTPLDDLPPR